MRRFLLLPLPIALLLPAAVRLWPSDRRAGLSAALLLFSGRLRLAPMGPLTVPWS